MSKTAKKAATKTTKEKTMKKPKVTLTVNEYDIPMLEITTPSRPVWISVNKALAILEANKNPELVSSETKHGRDLIRIKYGNGKSFLVGNTKIDAVVDAEKLIEKAIA